MFHTSKITETKFTFSMIWSNFVLLTSLIIKPNHKLSAPKIVLQNSISILLGSAQSMLFSENMKNKELKSGATNFLKRTEVT